SLSQTSDEGPIEPTQSPQVPNSLGPVQVWVPSVQAPTPRLPGGPRKQGCTLPGEQLQFSSAWPSQLSSMPLPQISAPPQPALGGTGDEQPIGIWPGAQPP